jgi:chromosome segregation ATPase
VSTDETEIRDLRERLVATLKELERLASERDDKQQLLLEISRENTALREQVAGWRQGVVDANRITQEWAERCRKMEEGVTQLAEVIYGDDGTPV